MKFSIHYRPKCLLTLLLLSLKDITLSTAFFPTTKLPFVSFVTTIVGDTKNQDITLVTKSNRNTKKNSPSTLFSGNSALEIISNDSSNTNNNNTMTGIAAKLARPNILELQPYRCARDDYSDGVLLDANENAFGPTSLPTKSLDPYDNSNTLERYPDPYQKDLKELFCRERGNGLKPSNVFVGVGSDEAIDLLMRIFCTPGAGRGGDNILITPPTYGMYKVCAKVNDVEIVSAPLTPDFDLDIPSVC